MFAAALANPTPPTVVGDLIRDIVNGDRWQLRYRGARRGADHEGACGEER